MSGQRKPYNEWLSSIAQVLSSDGADAEALAWAKPRKTLFGRYKATAGTKFLALVFVTLPPESNTKLLRKLRESGFPIGEEAMTLIGADNIFQEESKRQDGRSDAIVKTLLEFYESSILKVEEKRKDERLFPQEKELYLANPSALKIIYNNHLKLDDDSLDNILALFGVDSPERRKQWITLIKQEGYGDVVPPNTLLKIGDDFYPREDTKYVLEGDGFLTRTFVKTNMNPSFLRRNKTPAQIRELIKQMYLMESQSLTQFRVFSAMMANIGDVMQNEFAVSPEYTSRLFRQSKSSLPSIKQLLTGSHDAKTESVRALAYLTLLRYGIWSSRNVTDEDLIKAVLLNLEGGITPIEVLSLPPKTEQSLRKQKLLSDEGIITNINQVLYAPIAKIKPDLLQLLDEPSSVSCFSQQ